MAFEADKRLGRGREFLQLQEGLKVALAVFFGVQDSQTARSVTGFAVDQRKTSFGRNLLSVNGHLKITVDFVMLMALGQAVGVSDIIGVETANDKLFVLANR